MGLGAQMVAWHEDFCEQLADAGFHVVRFDNRDVGRSTHCRAPPPTVRQLLHAPVAPRHYTLADMAEDAAGLLRELDLAPAHVIGASMGGMIAQTLAARQPELVRSLVSIMSNTGGTPGGQPVAAAVPAVPQAPAGEREAFVARMENVVRRDRLPRLPRDIEEIRTLAALSYDRDLDRRGPGRQLAAIIASGDRTRGAAQHHRADARDPRQRRPLVGPPAAGRRRGRSRAPQLMMIEGMGHDLPRAIWPRLIDAIAQHARRADASAESIPPLQAPPPASGL